MPREVIRINPEFVIPEESHPNPHVPQPVHEHVHSLNSLITTLEAEEKLSPEAVSFGRLFANRHDAGYGTDLNLLNTDDAVWILRQMRDAVGSELDPGDAINYLYNNANSYLAARIIGHGVLGLVENTLYFEQSHDLSRRKALGMASVLAAHHPGYPITMVAGFLGESTSLPLDETRDRLRSGAEIHHPARSLFLIDIEGRNPELLRSHITNFAGKEMDVDWFDAYRAGIFGYVLDRLAAGTPPESMTLNDDGTVAVYGGEVIQKKYGLVAGDLLREESAEQPSIMLLYETVMQRLTQEAEAAIGAASSANQFDLMKFAHRESARIGTMTHAAQYHTLSTMYRMGLTGDFSQLESERETLLRFVSDTNDPSGLYALATYDTVIETIHSQPR